MKNFLLFILLLVIAWGCQESTDPSLSTKSFTKIYSNAQFSTAYFPIDVAQTDDGGYLILSEKRLYDSLARFIYLLRVDKYGNLVKELELDADYINPIGELTQQGTSYTFFCMEGTDTRMATVSDDLAMSTVDSVANGYPYPAASHFDGTSYEILNYDYENRQFILSVLNTDGDVQKTARFDIEYGNEVEGPIIDHFLHKGKTFPFQVGKLSNSLYYFNGFYNYTFSLVISDLSDDNTVTGLIQGQSNNGGFSNITLINDNVLACALFNYESNFILPYYNVMPASTLSVTDITGTYAMPELVPGTKVKSMVTSINNKALTFYAATTKSSQIGIYAYDQATKAFVGSRYLGFSNPFEIANFKLASDGGLIVCGTTYSAGRFPRICLFKISKSELNAMVGE